MNVDRTMIKRLHERLDDNGWMISVAESCTAGLVGGAVTSVPGSSDVFEGGVIAYSNDVKQSLLSVPEDILKREGAVSGPVARRMAGGVRELLDVEVGLSVTGIAGPGGARENKPVGRVHFGLALPSNKCVDQRTFDGSRQNVRMKSVNHAVKFALELL